MSEKKTYGKRKKTQTKKVVETPTAIRVGEMLRSEQRMTTTPLTTQMQEAGWVVRFNTRLNRAEVSDKKGWVELDDYKIAQVLWGMKCNDENNKYYPERNFKIELAVHLDEARVDPFAGWLMDAYDRTRSKKRVIDRVILDLFEVSSNVSEKYLKWQSMLPFLGSVNRAWFPGASQKQMLVLIGDQSIGKSLWIKESVPWEDYYRDGINFFGSQKDRIESCGGIFTEHSEMAGVSKADNESRKQFISCSNDQYREPYQRRTSSHPRQWIAIGTSNNRNVLPNDPSGNERYEVIELDKCRYTDPHEAISGWWAENRTAVWGDAVRYVSEGVKPHRPIEFNEESRDNNEIHRYRDDWIEDRIEEVMGYRDTNQDIPLEEIYEAVYKTTLAISKGEQMRLAEGLKNAGWIRVRKVKGGRRSYYRYGR